MGTQDQARRPVKTGDRLDILAAAILCVRYSSLGTLNSVVQDRKLTAARQSPYGRKLEA